MSVCSMLTVATRMLSADDMSFFSTFFFPKKLKNLEISLPYLKSAWKMYSNEYKQA